MRLFLVRHGESVDNVAGLYAGSRDSPLTAHGALQARRLAVHLAGRTGSIGPVSHVFASDLQRAWRTAQAVVDAQAEDGGALVVRRLAELRERDFGASEGATFTRAPDSSPSVHADAEPYDEMRARADRFVELYLRPLLEAADGEPRAVVVVAHGIILDVLLRGLLSRFAPTELSRLSARADAGRRSHFLASWSNTGYLEALVRPRAARGEVPASTFDSTPAPAPVDLSVTAVNCLDHLQGLKKTRGGIGSAKFDDKQKTMDSFLAPAPKKQTSAPGDAG